MPELPKPRRRQLKMHPDPELQLEALVRHLDRLALGVERLVERFDELTVSDGMHTYLRTTVEK